MGEPLATAADVRAFLNLAGNADEALLTSLCAAASDFVYAYCETDSFVAADFDELYNGTGSRRLVPNHFPINSVAEVKVDNRLIAPRDLDANINTGYSFSKTTIALHGYVFTRELQNVRIKYNAGFTELPEALKQAVVEIVAEKYQRRLRMGISSKTIGQESISYSQNDLLPHTKAVLNQYKTTFLTS